MRLQERLRLAAKGICRMQAQGRREGWDKATMFKLALRLCYLTQARRAYGCFLRQNPMASSDQRFRVARLLAIPMGEQEVLEAVRVIESLAVVAAEME